MVQRQKDRDGTTRLISGNVATRWGTLAAWPYFGDDIDQPVVFSDGRRARIGDLVVSTNGWSLGQMCTVIKVYPSGNVDVRVENFRIRLATDTQWKNVGDSGQPAFAAGWSNFGGTFQTARFRSVDGTVMLEGLVKSTTGAIGPIFTLPIGFRPYKDHLYSAAVSSVATSTVNVNTSSASTGANHRHGIPADVTLGPNNDTVVHSHNIPATNTEFESTVDNHSHSVNAHAHEVPAVSARVYVKSNGEVYLATPILPYAGDSFVSLSSISYYIME